MRWDAFPDAGCILGCVSFGPRFSALGAILRKKHRGRGRDASRPAHPRAFRPIDDLLANGATATPFPFQASDSEESITTKNAAECPRHAPPQKPNGRHRPPPGRQPRGRTPRQEFGRAPARPCPAGPIWPVRHQQPADVLDHRRRLLPGQHPLGDRNPKFRAVPPSSFFPRMRGSFPFAVK